MINYGLIANRQGAFSPVAQGIAFGQQLRNQRELRERQDRALDLREQALQGQAEQRAVSQRRDNLPMLTRLLETVEDEPGYQRAKVMAQRYGVDISALPQNFDPAWKQQSLTMMRAMGSPEGQKVMSTAGKQAYDEGLRPNTPQFNQRVRQLVEAGLTKTLTTQQGGSAFTFNPVTGEREVIAAPANMIEQRSVAQRPPGASDGDLITQARQAIAQGKDPELVRQRLIEMGVQDPTGL